MKQPRALIHLICAAIWAALTAGWLMPAAVLAEGVDADRGAYRKVVRTSWVEEWDPAAQRWVRVGKEAAAPFDASAPGFVVAAADKTVRREGAQPVAATKAAPHGAYLDFARPAPQPFGGRPAFVQYGPFRVLDDRRAALIGPTDIASPREFDAMLRDHPGLAVLELVEAPGTSHDLANLALGRKIRAAGLETHVPTGGSVRSGAVELFLAGTRQQIAPGATFAVHSWMDSRGLEPRHFAEDAPENRLYLDYYEEMGMAADHARAFYAMTNSVPHSGALWLDAATMKRWIQPMLPAPSAPVTLAVAAPAEEAKIPDLAPLHDSLIRVSRSARDTVALLAVPASAPVLPYSDLAVVALARLDSRAVFP